MPVVLQAAAADCESFHDCTVVTITEQSVVSFSGAGSASVTPVGSTTPIANLSASEPTAEILYPGDFTICLSAPCEKSASVSVDAIAPIPTSGGGGPTAVTADCGDLNVNLCELADLLAGMTEIKDAIEAQQDFEIITSGWLCDVGGTDTWVQTVTPYIDGVAQTPVTNDSGISCDEPAPVDGEVTQVVECVGGVEQVQFYQIVFTDGVPGAPVALGAPIITGKACNVEPCNTDVLPHKYCYDSGGAGPVTLDLAGVGTQVDPFTVLYTNIDGAGTDLTIATAGTDTVTLNPAGALIEGFGFDVVTVSVSQGTIEGTQFSDPSLSTVDTFNFSPAFATHTSTNGFTQGGGFQIAPGGVTDITFAPGVASYSFDHQGSPGSQLIITQIPFLLAAAGADGDCAYAVRDCATGAIEYFDQLTHAVVDPLDIIPCPDEVLNQAIQLPNVCVTVDGLNPQYATPIVLLDQITGEFVGKKWLDSLCNEITGVVAPSEDCSTCGGCGCDDCDDCC